MRILWGFGALLVLMVGCSVPVPEPGGGAIVLVDGRPGIGGAGGLDDPPAFVLYGDGRAIVREDRDTGVVKLVEYRVTPQRIRALFEEAADAGLFGDEDYSSDDQVLDGGTLVIMLRSTEREHLIEIPSPIDKEHGARGAAARFAESLRRTKLWAADDFSSPPVPYRPGRVAVTFAESGSAKPGTREVARAWPLPGVEPIQSGCVVLTGVAAGQAQVVGETLKQTTRWPHGDATFHAWVRPLLPDEADCRATSHRYVR